MRRRLAFLQRLGGDARGVAALEFALVVPVMIVVYLVGFEVAEAATVYRKLNDTTVQLANVSAQYTSMGATDTTQVLNASSQIMAPYPTARLTIVLSEVTTNAKGKGVVTWSQAYQGAALDPKTKMTMPSGFQTANTSYMLVQTTYSYQPTIGAAFIGPITLRDQIFMLPRASASIPYTG
ncbi:MAG TPA: TadE/TadG family type IV pilus assembly protein [Caulobacteraceae bacterium]|jgi:Flp pilus assembly protein TadG